MRNNHLLLANTKRYETFKYKLYFVSGNNSKIYKKYRRGELRMKALTTIVFSMLFVLSAVMVAAQDSFVPVAIERAEIDDTEIEPFGFNQLDIERAQEFELELELHPWENAKDVEIRAFISGYEFSDVNDIEDHIGPFDFDANVTYVKKMHLTLPDDVDVDDYQLRVILSDRNGWELVYNYQLQVNTERHSVKIEDVTLSPGSAVKAGQALLATVRLENKGQKDEDDVKVTASIPALGVSASEFIEEIENDEEEETEELFLRLPKCAEPGVYEMVVEAFYNDRHSKVAQSGKVTVLENEACRPEQAPVVVVQQASQNATTEVSTSDSSGKVRSALEIILLVLVALLVIVGLIIGFSRMRGEE